MYFKGVSQQERPFVYSLFEREFRTFFYNKKVPFHGRKGFAYYKVADSTIQPISTQKGQRRYT